LFLPGYIIQQRTVQGLQAAIRPRAPLPHIRAPSPAAIDPRSKASRPFGRLKDYAKLQLHLQEQGKAFSWNRLAYAQVVREHSEVCDALILFGELHRSKSPVPKLLIFPAAWISHRDNSGQEWETTRRLLRKAHRRYGAKLVPIEGSEIWKDPREKNLFLLKDYERVITLPPPGLVLNSLSLDTLLAYHQIGETISAYPPVNGNDSGGSMIMARPSDKHIPALPLSTISLYLRCSQTLFRCARPTHQTNPSTQLSSCRRLPTYTYRIQNYRVQSMTCHTTNWSREGQKMKTKASCGRRCTAPTKTGGIRCVDWIWRPGRRPTPPVT